ncbi:hypothetical protein OQZ33_13395 [Pedobacter sp. MC2016-05]|uniref:hypothetical protein n=1 Tax=Pedobacter sp. MC2016-05 TaxID=2994474 RepID=UPI002246717F|nr:hypothetical protein [Pedobacter sp. MC2016-05]MCX2475326.1 hypothetical protein [Pedobacter sp. MC2016-05]
MKNKYLGKEVNYTDAVWLEDIINKTTPKKNGIPFSILSKPVSEVKKNYVLPAELLDEFAGFTHMIAIYMCDRAYKKQRLLYYHTDHSFRNIKNDDPAFKLLRKMKLIANPEKFDMESEQALGLTTGLINRLQSNRYYEIKSINERVFFDLNVKFGRFEDRELVHITLLKPFYQK